MVFIIYKERGEKMNVTSISMASNLKSNQASFKGDNKQVPKPLVDLTDDVSDDTVVFYSTCGPNYVFPVTAGQVREAQAKAAVNEAVRSYSKQINEEETESEKEYLNRKLYSTEWTM